MAFKLEKHFGKADVGTEGGRFTLDTRTESPLSTARALIGVRSRRGYKTPRSERQWATPPTQQKESREPVCQTDAQVVQGPSPEPGSPRQDAPAVSPLGGDGSQGSPLSLCPGETPVSQTGGKEMSHPVISYPGALLSDDESPLVPPSAYKTPGTRARGRATLFSDSSDADSDKHEISPCLQNRRQGSEGKVSARNISLEARSPGKDVGIGGRALASLLDSDEEEAENMGTQPKRPRQRHPRQVP